MAESRTVAVIGGGITGISAALTAARAGHDVHLYEASDRLGGKIAELDVDGQQIPSGPDAFLARRPEMIDLATSLGLASQLTTPAASSARIYRDGQLHALPPGILGIPTADGLDAALLSPSGADRARQDLTTEDDRPAGDESVGALIRRRLGDEVLEYLVDPLLGGINAGDTDRLSVLDGVPQIATLRDRHPSLLTAAAETLAAATPNPGPVFHSIEGGLCRLVDAAQAELIERSVGISFGLPAGLDRTSAGWSVTAETAIEADDVIVTTPAFVTANLVSGFAPTLADTLSNIDYSSVALAVLKVAPGSIDIDPTISGVLVPRLCGHHVTAVSFASHKWPDLTHDGSRVLRVSVGRRTDSRFVDMSDADLLKAIADDLAEILDTAIAPAGHVARWEQSLPQYDVGHRDRIVAIDATLAELQGLHLTGAWRNGLGLPASAGSGHAAALQIV